MIRLVLDTNIVVSGLLWDGPPRILLAPDPSRFVRCTSLPLIEELADVVSRPKLAKRIAFSGRSPRQLVELYKESALLVNPHFLAGVASDPDDDVVIGTAVAAHADFIVTGDLPLRSVLQYAGIRIISAREAVDRIVAG